jgi:NAD(P)H-hydrate epimerase
MERLPVLPRESIRSLDARAVREHGLPPELLMENAARACADVAWRMLGGQPSWPVAVVCGPGNNGGDGFAIARTLLNHGIAAKAYFGGAPEDLERLAPEVRRHLELLTRLGARVDSLAEDAALGDFAARLERAPLVVDALFGTGLARPLAEPWLSIVRAINTAARPVLAVDVPSGLEADSGEILGEAVRATRTVTFVAAKPGFFRGHGPRCVGELSLAEIGIPRAWIVAALEAQSLRGPRARAH